MNFLLYKFKEYTPLFVIAMAMIASVGVTESIGNESIIEYTLDGDWTYHADYPETLSLSDNPTGGITVTINVRSGIDDGGLSASEHDLSGFSLDNGGFVELEYRALSTTIIGGSASNDLILEVEFYDSSSVKHEIAVEITQYNGRTYFETSFANDLDIDLSKEENIPEGLSIDEGILGLYWHDSSVTPYFKDADGNIIYPFSDWDLSNVEGLLNISVDNDFTGDTINGGTVLATVNLKQVNYGHDVSIHDKLGPIISTNPSQLAFLLKPDVTQYSQTFKVWNSDSGEINYTISTDSSWLTCTPDSGSSTGEEDTITVNYDTAGLNGGIHRATITISDPGADNSPVQIPVTMAIGDSDPVYRFFNMPIGTAHFYTSSAPERDAVIDAYSDIFNFEGIAWYAYLNQEDAPGSKPVYRFLNLELGSVHFYTISEEEKDAVVANYPDVFQYEGIAFYAYPPGSGGSKPVYRFLNRKLGSAHFYTISEAEKDAVISNYSDLFEYEGIAFYASDRP